MFLIIIVFPILIFDFRTSFLRITKFILIFAKTRISRNVSLWIFSLPLKSFFIEINPLPGGLTGWYEIADTMRFNYYTPYTSIGELYNYSPTLLLIFFALLGFISSGLVIFQSSRNATSSNILQLFNGGSLLLFFLLTTQYNLRSSMRVLYLALLVNVFFYFRAKTLLKKKGV